MTTNHVPARTTAAPATRLTLIGYWAGPGTHVSWPSAVDFVDLGWDQDDRDYIVSYLIEGRVVWNCMGYSPCRFCGLDNGDLELSDGTYLWPSGLVHYLVEHGVRLPDEFVQHAYARTESLEQAERDPEWWASATPPPPTAEVVEAPADGDEDLASQERTVVWPAERAARALPALQPRHLVVDALPADDQTQGTARLVLPADFDEYGWEVEAKGVFCAAEVEVDERRVAVTFYDPVRLAQDIEADHAAGDQVAVRRLIVVETVTIGNMERAVRELPPSFLALS